MGWEDPLEKEMATHSSILAWKSHGLGAWQSTVHGVAESDVTEGLRTMTNDTIPVLGDEMLGDVETRRVRKVIYSASLHQLKVLAFPVTHTWAVLGF